MNKALIFLIISLLFLGFSLRDQSTGYNLPTANLGVLVTKVIDGDTIEIEGGVRVRYLGVDTPETKDPRKTVECFGKEAYNKNRDLVEGKRVILEKDITDKDKYDRLLRFVYLALEDGQMLFVNDYLIRDGYGHVLTIPPDVKFAEQFLEAQKQARVNNTAIRKLQINDAMLKVEIADTKEKRSKGLAGRQSLATDEGMLFVFPKADKYPFWMKGLSFPIDFVWINGDKVTDILSNVPPPSSGQTDESLAIYSSNQEVDKVLEVSSGTVQRLNIKAGDTVKIL